MKPVFYYEKVKQMEARSGTNYATVYYLQNALQREAVRQHVLKCAREIGAYLQTNPQYLDWHLNTPLKGFKKVQGQPNRTTVELINDMVQEVNGIRSNGKYKDLARAPIERWNKLFKGTDYEFEMQEGFVTKVTTFDNLFRL